MSVKRNHAEAFGDNRQHEEEKKSRSTYCCCVLKGKGLSRGDLNRMILEITAKEAQRDPLDVYRSFLDSSFSLVLDFSLFDDLEDRDLDFLYKGHGSYYKRPYFINIIDNQFHKQTLEDVTGQQLVLLQRNVHGKVSLLHDTRLSSWTCQIQASTLELLPSHSESPTTVIVIEQGPSKVSYKLWHCKKQERSLLMIEEKKYILEANITDRVYQVTKRNNFYQIINAFCLGSPGKPAAWVMKQNLPLTLDMEKKSLFQLFRHGPDWKSDFFRHLNKHHDSSDISLNILLVCYTGRDEFKFKRARADHFTILCHFFHVDTCSNRLALLSTARIIGISKGKFVYEITDASLVEEIRRGQQQRFITFTQPELGFTPPDIKDSASSAIKEAKELEKVTQAVVSFCKKKLKKKYNRRSGKYQKEPLYRYKFHCTCRVCLQTPSFSQNMLEKTPGGRYQFPIAFHLGVEDYVHILGLGQAVLEKVRLASKLSIASYDLESINRDVVQKESLPYDLKMSVTNAHIPRTVLSRQSILLIGYTDALAKLNNEDVVILDVRDFKHQSTNLLVQHFLSYLIKRQQAAEEVKTHLLEDLIRWVSSHYKRHLDFHRRMKLGFPLETDGASLDEQGAFLSSQESLEVESLWNQSFLGKFYIALQRLKCKFVVSAFNASSYDLVMLAKKLVRAHYVLGRKGAYAKEDGEYEEKGGVTPGTNTKVKVIRKKIKINRQANDISSMQIGSIFFEDMKKLVAPGASLDSVAKMCKSSSASHDDNEDQGCKGIFPFSKLTSSAYLEEPCLPEDPNDWRSDISTKSPSAEDVKKVLQLFKKKRFCNVGDYLKYYLNIDVTLLQDCTEALFDMTTEIQKINFIDRHAFTAASVSHASSNTYLMNHLRLSMCATNDARIFSVSIKWGVFFDVIFITKNH